MSNKLIILILGGMIVVALYFYKLSQTASVLPQTHIAQPEQINQPAHIGFSYQDILNNDEFKTGMQQAVLNSDIEQARELQSRAVDIAEVARLPEAEIQLLSGDKGLSFMQFLAKRQLFAAAFERRYLGLEGIQDIKLIYPEAQSLFAKSDALIAQRDKMILEIAAEMANGGNIDEHILQAKQHWKEIQQAKTK
jgi:hypothetical protein